MSDVVERLVAAMKAERNLWSTKPRAKSSVLWDACRDDVVVEHLPKGRAEAHLRYMELKNTAQARAALAAMRYVDGADEDAAVAVSKGESVDPVICIEILDRWIDTALAPAHPKDSTP